MGELQQIECAVLSEYFTAKLLNDLTNHKKESKLITPSQINGSVLIHYAPTGPVIPPRIEDLKCPKLDYKSKDNKCTITDEKCYLLNDLWHSKEE